MAVSDHHLHQPAASTSSSPTKRKRATKAVYHEPDGDDSGPEFGYPPDEYDHEPKGKGKAKASPKKAKKEDKVPEEKRLARFRKTCPLAVLERADRVKSQRMFLIDREREGDELMEEFKILGSTGNVYSVIIGLMPTCSCPDSSKNGTCKHIIFAMIKVLGVPTEPASSNLWYQRALLTSELATIFANAPPSPNASTLASGDVRRAYREAEGIDAEDKFGDLKGSGGIPEKKVPEEGDDCPICYDELSPNDRQLTYCLGAGGCGRPIHNECLGQWVRTQQGLGKEVTCCWCRSKLSTGPARASGSSGRATQDGIYTNLGSFAGINSQRDVSSYYMGPRRGESYNSSTIAARAYSFQNDQF